MINSNGFDAGLINLSLTSKRLLKKTFDRKTIKGGFISLWSDEIRLAIESIKERAFLYSFSISTFASIRTLSEKKSKKIIGLICDSGPFMELGIKIIWNHLLNDKIINRLPKRVIYHLLGYMGLGFQFEDYLIDDLKKIPPDFPILSIRGWKDKVTPHSYIEKVFNHMAHLDLYTLDLPESGHLSGLNDSPQIYEQKVVEFLKRFSEKVLL